jgi:hypothetical protein
MARRTSATARSRERDDGEKLRLFVQRVDEMEQNYLARNGIHLHFHIAIDSEAGMTMETEQPEEEAVKAFVLDFRHLISDNEDVCVRRIHNICEQRLIPEDVKQHLRAARAGWRTMLDRAVHTLTVNGRTRGPDDVADLWINGYYFHNDVDLRDELDAMSHLGRDLLWRQFLIYVGITRGYLIQVREVVAKGLDEGWFAF